MSSHRWIGRAGGVLGVASLFAFAACQQVLGLDQPTVSINAINRICECVPLTQQGLAFAGAEEAACETALAEQPDELLLAVAENDCTDCANVTPCYALLTEAGDEGDACSDSSDCASWACAQGVFVVKLTLEDGKPTPALISNPTQATCAASCSSCADALDAMNSEIEVVACAEAEGPLLALLGCVVTGANGCDCLGQGGVTPECIQCLQQKAADEDRCADEFDACSAATARPIPVPQ